MTCLRSYMFDFRFHINSVGDANKFDGNKSDVALISPFVESNSVTAIEENMEL